MQQQHKVRRRPWRRLLAATTLTLAVAACGGGGGGDEGGGSGFIPPSSQSAQKCSPNNGYAAPGLRTGSLDIEKQWVRSYFNEAYLWYDEVLNVNPNGYSDESSSARLYTSLDSYFRALKVTARDRFSFTYPTADWVALSQSGVTPGYGIEIVLGKRTPPRNIRVLYVEPNSEAAAKGLQRGDQLYTVDGVSADVDTPPGVAILNAGIAPSATAVGVQHTFQFTRGNLLQPPLTMTVANITKRPVLVTNTINYNNGEKVGYLLFNDHIATAETQLRDAFAFFQTQAVSDLVIDLRYNGGGYLYIASQLAYMVAGPARTNNQVFEQLTFSAKRSAENEAFSFLNTPLNGGPVLPSLNLPRVYVLATDNTCSASESVINSLRGVGVDVRLIGSTTCGKPYGFSAKDNCGISYFPIEFQGVNALGFGAYASGFVPSLTNNGANVAGCSASDDLNHPLGDPAESMLATALGYRISGNTSCPVLGGRAGQLSVRPAAANASGGGMLRSPVRENRILLPRH